MQLGMVGLGRMGANLVRRLMRDGHDCVVYDVNAQAVATLKAEGAVATGSLDQFVAALTPPRTAWVMVPAALTGDTVDALASRMSEGDVIIDGGNSYYRDDIERADKLAALGVHHVDIGTSGGVHGLERGFCLMIGGEPQVVERLDPIFRSIAPGVDAAARTPGRTGEPSAGRAGIPPLRASRGRAFCQDGPQRDRVRADGRLRRGAQHPAQGQCRADRAAGERREHAAPGPERYYQYELTIPEVAEVWRRGSVIASWLLDLTAASAAPLAGAGRMAGRVSDSGEGRWTAIAAVDEGVPAHVLTAALYERFSSRGEADFGDRLLSAMRREFGGHAELPAGG